MAGYAYRFVLLLAAVGFWTGQAAASGSLAPSGGEVAKKSGDTISATYDIHLPDKFRIQIDGLFGHVTQKDVYSVGGHLFWRDKSIGFAGIYTNFTHWSDSIETQRAAIQGALYHGRMNLEGQGGWEGGDIPGAFYDIVNLAYYPLDNGRLFAGHRRARGRDAAAFGGEYLLPFFGAAPFAEGRIGKKEDTGFWVGVRFYFDYEQDTLLDIHRDGTIPSDPMDQLFAGIDKAPPPPPVVCLPRDTELPTDGCDGPRVDQGPGD